MIDSMAARVVAERYLDEHVRPWVGEPVAIVDAATRETASVFVFFYNTVTYLQTGAASHALAGNGPVIVSRATGEPRLGGTSRPWEDQLDDR